MNSLIDTPTESELNTSIPNDLLFFGTDVLPPNLIKEDEMEMIDPEDPQPLSGKENKNQKPDTIAQPLNLPANRKQRIYNLLEYIIACFSFCFGMAMLYYYNSINKECTHDPFGKLIREVQFMMFWEVFFCVVLAFTCNTNCGNCFCFVFDIIQAIVLIRFTYEILLCNEHFTLIVQVARVYSYAMYKDDQDEFQRKEDLLNTLQDDKRDEEGWVRFYTYWFFWLFVIIAISQIICMIIRYHQYYKTTTVHAPNINK